MQRREFLIVASVGLLSALGAKVTLAQRLFGSGVRLPIEWLSGPSGLCAELKVRGDDLDAFGRWFNRIVGCVNRDPVAGAPPGTMMVDQASVRQLMMPLPPYSKRGYEATVRMLYQEEGWQKAPVAWLGSDGSLKPKLYNEFTL